MHGIMDDQQGDVRPPQEDDGIPTQGEGEPFEGTNPWSGPYLVLVIFGVAAVLFAAAIATALFH